jgi:hypothetical protein
MRINSKHTDKVFVAAAFAAKTVSISLINMNEYTSQNDVNYLQLLQKQGKSNETVHRLVLTLTLG